MTKECWCQVLGNCIWKQCSTSQQMWYDALDAISSTRLKRKGSFQHSASCAKDPAPPISEWSHPLWLQPEGVLVPLHDIQWLECNVQLGSQPRACQTSTCSDYSDPMTPLARGHVLRCFRYAAEIPPCTPCMMQEGGSEGVT